MKQFTPLRLRRCMQAVLVSLAFAGCLRPSTVHAWGAMHGSITQSAFSVLPEWEQRFLAGQRSALINLYCMIPDLAQAPAYRKEFGPLVVLPNREIFSHLPHKSREKNASQMRYYLVRAIEAWRAGELDLGARWAGCLLHFLQDSGRPAHTIQGDNQMGLMKDLLPVPDEFRNVPLHSLIEEGKLFIHLPGYKPRLLGTSPDEVILHLMERYNAMVRNARSQVMPILQGVFSRNQEAINAGQLRAATMDAEVAADVLHTVLCIARERFEPGEVEQLAETPLSSLTPVEVINQSYFPQHTYYSDPYYGFPVRDGILSADRQRQPLSLQVEENGSTATREFSLGLGLGTGCRLTYALPPALCDSFEMYAGLHPVLGVQGKAAIKVLGDGRLLYDSGVLTGESPAKHINVSIWGVKELVIVTEGRNTVKGHNYVVLGAPLLRRTTDSGKLSQMQKLEPPLPLPENVEQAFKENKARTE